jgi:hypothetical protein
MRNFFALIFTVGLSFSLFATTEKMDSVDKIKLAEQVLETMGIGQQISASFDSVKDIQRKIIAKTLENAPKSKEVEEFRKKVLKISEEALSWEKMKIEFVKAYSEEYSSEELRGMLEFFSSKAGKAFLVKNPKIQRQLLPIVQEKFKNSTFKIRSMTHEFMKGLMLQGKTLMPESLKGKSKK